MNPRKVRDTTYPHTTPQMPKKEQKVKTRGQRSPFPRQRKEAAKRLMAPADTRGVEAEECRHVCPCTSRDIPALGR